MFNDFIIGYFEEHHTQVDVTRLKAAQAYPESGVFEKFPDLNEKFEKAYLEFLKQVEISWKEEDNQEGSTENNQEFGQEETLE